MSELKALVDDLAEGAADDLWAALEDAGLTGIGVPEEHGGSGGDLDQLVEVVQALGSHGAAVPLAERATASWVLATAGETPAAAASIGVGVRGDDGTVSVTLPHGRTAARAVVVLPGDGVFVLDLTGPGPARLEAQDPAGQPLDTVEVGQDRLHRLSGLSDRDVLARLALLRCAAMVGASRAAYLLTDRHVRTREQFGRPLVRLPAVAASLARMRVELLQAEVALAAAVAAADTEQASSTATVARIVCGGVATEVGRLAHQLHGAIGITIEYSLHPLTRLLWSLRDADLAEEQWARDLGELVLTSGEDALWNGVTAPLTRV